MPEPIRDDELDALFGRALGAFPSVLIAVSGGVDSTALMHLVARWRPKAKPQVLVATVDHGLREGSVAEAAWVAVQASALGLGHRTLTWDGAKPKTGVQAAARVARYEALGALGVAWFGDRLPCAVVTAHHREDQAETVLMRLARGSGVDGLAGIAPVRWLERERLALVRPLLQVPKARLIATLEAAGATWCDDPSNENTAFERVRLRQATANLADIGVTTEALALTAQRIGRAREALDTAVAAAERRILSLNDGAYAQMSRAAFSWLPEEIRVRIASRVLFAFGGQDLPPQLAQVEALVAQIAEARTGWRTTLGGCIASLTARAIIVHRELGRARLAAVRLTPGAATWWDRRFMIALSPRSRRAVRVEPVAAGDTNELLRRSKGLPPAAAATLPSCWEVGRGAAADSDIQVAFTYPRLTWA